MSIQAVEGVLCIVEVRDPEDELIAILEELQLWLVAHPVAVRAIVRALVEEGKRFAATPAGHRWQARLLRSDLLRRLRIVWDSSLLSSLDTRDDSPVPSAVVDALIMALTRSDLREVLVRLSEWGVGDE